MRGRFDDIITEGLFAKRYLKLQADAQTLGAAVTITDNSGVINAYDCGGSSRNVTMPTRAAANDGVVRLFINLSTAGEVLTIKEASTTLVVVPSGAIGIVVATGTVEAPGTRAWMGFLMGGEDLAIADDLSVTGDLSVSGNSQLGNSVSDGIALYGTTTISQRAGTAQSSSLIQSASLGTAGAAILLEMWTTLTNLGAWKGSS